MDEGSRVIDELGGLRDESSPAVPLGARPVPRGIEWRAVQSALLDRLAVARAKQEAKLRLVTGPDARALARARPRDPGVTLTRAPDPVRATRVRLESSARCAVLGAAVAAISTGSKGLVLELAPSLDVESVRRLVEPALTSGRIAGIEALPAEPPSSSRCSAIVVTPYYYSRSDLDRLVWQVVLEASCPCPSAERGLRVLTSTSWDQADEFEERLYKELGSAGPVELSRLATKDCPSTLAAAREELANTGLEAVACFVYPLWRERPEVEHAVSELTTVALIAVVNHRPSTAWWLGQAPFALASGSPTVIDVHQLLRPLPYPSQLERMVRDASEPSASRRARLVVDAWAGAIFG